MRTMAERTGAVQARLQAVMSRGTASDRLRVASLTFIVEVLANNKPLEPRHYDGTQLSGEWG